MKRWIIEDAKVVGEPKTMGAISAALSLWKETGERKLSVAGSASSFHTEALHFCVQTLFHDVVTCAPHKNGFAKVWKIWRRSDFYGSLIVGNLFVIQDLRELSASVSPVSIVAFVWWRIIHNTAFYRSPFTSNHGVLTCLLLC
mmetsp:Transcript_2211/g.3500  ORF Transcript_2211/g.3500 Transcript_2211/m.3500 type:complete len:143 (-) Transcript_2211:36-464(-)